MMDPASQFERAGPGRVLDDRGVPRAVMPSMKLWRDRRMGDMGFAAAASRVSRLMVSGAGVKKQIVAGVVLGWLPLMAWEVLVATGAIPRGPSWTFALASGVSIALTFSGAFWAMRRFEKSLAADAARLMLIDALCPSCAYGLHGLPEDPDGCLVCPECGAAWRRGRMTRTLAYTESKPAGPVRVFARGYWRAGIFVGEIRVNDDGGVERPLIHRRLWHVERPVSAERAERLEDASRAISRQGRFGRFIAASLYAIEGVGLAFLAWHIGVRTLASGALAVLMATISVICVYCAVGVLRGSLGVKAAHIRREMLFRRLCPSCAADLPRPEEAGAEHSEGLVACSQCGAHWKTADRASAP